MKKLHLKIWPQIEGLLPVILPWQNIDIKENNIFIDFTNCDSVYSSSLTILLIRLIKLIKNEPIEDILKIHHWL